jgi:hypothetical protein
MSDKEMVLRSPAFYDDFEKYVADLTDEELGHVVRLGMKKSPSEIKHKNLVAYVAALAMHRGIGIWRTNDFYAKHNAKMFADCIRYLGKRFLCKT